MNILVITNDYYPQRGGVVTVVEEVSERLAKMGHRITVLAIGSSFHEAMVNSVRIIRIASPSHRLLLGYSLELGQFLHRSGIVYHTDLVHIHGYHSLLSLSAIHTNAREKPMVFSPHYHAMGHTQFRNALHKIYKPIGKTILETCNTIVCASRHESKLIQRDFGIDAVKIRVIAPGVNEVNPYLKSDRKNNLISLLYVGYVREYKGIQYILRAMRILKEDLQETKLDIVGTGEYESEIKGLIHDLNLEGNVFWYSDVPYDFLRRKYLEADILLLLSRAEAYGLVVAEALAVGTPCIVANISALQEFSAEPGCYGVDYPPNPQDLAELISGIHNHDTKVGPFDTSKIRSWDAVAKEYEAMYFDVIDGLDINRGKERIE